MKHLFGLLFALLFTINGAAAQSADAVFYMEMDTLGGGITGVQDYPKLYAAIKARGYDAALLQDLFADNWLRVLPK